MLAVALAGVLSEAVCWQVPADSKERKTFERRLEFPLWCMAWDCYALGAAVLEQVPLGPWCWVLRPVRVHVLPDVFRLGDMSQAQRDGDRRHSCRGG